MITAPQGETRSPKAFQVTIIENVTAKLLSEAKPPCLLRSPTGSGKTFMLTHALQRVSSARPTLWLWFVPFVNLVAQTVDSIDSEGAGLVALQMAQALNEEPAANLVLISTVQGVASAKDRKVGYTSAEDDDTRSIANYIERARAQGLAIGCVVDEAHIALTSTTEFGQFVQWLHADYLLMATATPRDDKLSSFIAVSGYSHYETFSVSRSDVVKARLNKTWIDTVVYDLRESMQGVTDLKLTVLRRAWRRHQTIERELRARGLVTVPLLLVQVSNGDKTIEEAIDFLNKSLNIPLHAIGQHSADEPDPVMMAAIANDTSKQVLVFKQSAGTGFDAPRAFVLASTKPVNDPDFATQFIGRVMRVAPELQRVFPDAATVPPELDTAYVFLANATAQAGFAQAAESIKAVKSELEGQTEALYLRRTAFGGVALTNRVTNQSPLSYDLSLLPTITATGANLPPRGMADTSGAAIADPRKQGETGSLFGSTDDGEAADELLLDGVEIDSTVSPGKSQVVHVSQAPRKAPTNSDELIEAFAEAEIRTVRRAAALAVPARFISETRSAFEAIEFDIKSAVDKLPLDAVLQANAIRAALDRMTEREIYTELFTGETREEAVQVTTDSHALLGLTTDKLATIALEEQDAQDVITHMAQRLMGAVEEAYELQDDSARLANVNLRSKARQAACWVIHKRFRELEELLHSQWASKAHEAPAQLLPDALIVPVKVPLVASRKSSYGIFFPAKGEIQSARDALSPQARVAYKSAKYFLDPVAFDVATMDATYEFNEGELAFAKALERAEFVHWWHRNPQGKPFSVSIVRADSENLFYPDFVVCMEHVRGEAPMMRLVDPKHDTKDASRKAQHVSHYYGKVLFLTKDQGRYKIVNDDGSVGDTVDLDDLAALKAWMRDSMPLGQVT